MNINKLDDYLICGDYGWINNWSFGNDWTYKLIIYNNANYHYPKVVRNNLVEFYLICG